MRKWQFFCKFAIFSIRFEFEINCYLMGHKKLKSECQRLFEVEGSTAEDDDSDSTLEFVLEVEAADTAQLGRGASKDQSSPAKECV